MLLSNRVRAKEYNVYIRSWMIASLLCVTTSAFAVPDPHVGASIAIPLITKDPEYLHGYRAAIWYQPEKLIWQHWHIYFDGAFGRWWITHSEHYNSLNIYSVAPVFRYYFLENRYFSPYINASIGFAWLTRTRIDHQNLGMHYAFQDQLAIGATFGARHQLSVSLGAMHYSNGSLCKKNGGITIPLLINAEYGFA